MQFAIRTQADDKQDQYSLEEAEDLAAELQSMPDMTRQEFKDETNVNWLLQRYGVNIPQKPIQYGQVNFDLDLQQATSAVQEVKRVYARMPDEVKKKYPTWQALLLAIENGTVGFDIVKPPTPPEESPSDTGGGQT